MTASLLQQLKNFFCHIGRAPGERRHAKGAKMTVFGHSDHPLKDMAADRLGLAPYAQSLSDFIRSCDTPLTVAIQGDWGTGKTSLMHMVEGALSNSPDADKIETIWFNTWQYSQFATHDYLPASLLSFLLRRIAGPDDSLVKSGMRVLGRLAAPAANAALRFATAGASEIGDFIGRGGQGGYSDPAADAEKLKSDIADAIAKKQSQGTDRIVIFIDDLDRILPERAVEILEIIKLFLDWRGCVFVLALDYAVVSRGLEQRFKLTEQDLGGRSFFDKIIQLPFTVPVARYDVDLYMEGLLAAMDLPLERSDYPLFAGLVRYSVSINPRGIKRVLNSLQLLILVAKAQGLIGGVDTAEDRLVVRNLFAILCLQMGFEPVYLWLAERGREVEEADLLALSSNGDVAGERNTELGAAIAALQQPERIDDVFSFAGYFVSCIRQSERSSEGVTADELKRFRATLTLTKITAVAGSAEKPLAETVPQREFRLMNRQIMRRVKDDLEARLAPYIERDGEVLKLYQPHSSPTIDLIRKLNHPDYVELRIEHGIKSMYLYISGAQYAIRSAAERLADSPFANWEKFQIGSREIILMHKEIDPELGIEEREAMLLGQICPGYVEVTSFFEKYAKN
ncbi:MAG: P-loop NTPase fold protein [Pseudomonadota bacterium]